MKTKDKKFTQLVLFITGENPFLSDSYPL